MTRHVDTAGRPQFTVTEERVIEINESRGVYHKFLKEKMDNVPIAFRDDAGWPVDRAAAWPRRAAADAARRVWGGLRRRGGGGGRAARRPCPARLAVRLSLERGGGARSGHSGGRTRGGLKASTKADCNHQQIICNHAGSPMV